MENRITITFKTNNWRKEFERKGVCFQEAGHSFSELEEDEDLEVISERESFGDTIVVLDCKGWIASCFIDMKKIECIGLEGQKYVKGAGRYVADDMNKGNDKMQITLNEVVKW